MVLAPQQLSVKRTGVMRSAREGLAPSESLNASFARIGRVGVGLRFTPQPPNPQPICCDWCPCGSGPGGSTMLCYICNNCEGPVC